MKKQKFTVDENIVQELEAINSRNENLSNSNLSKANLQNINLVNCDIQNSDFSKANLENASLYGANLKGCNLFKVNLKNANLNNSNLENCNLLGANFENTKLRNVKWGKNYKVVNEIEAETAYKNKDYKLAKEKYKEAEDIYRAIKISMQSQTLGEETGQFFIREMIAKRKQFDRFSCSRI